MSVNKVTLVGNLGANPEMNYTATGKAVTTLRLATNETFKDAAGVTHKRTEWHRVVVWGQQAESCCEYLSKGRQVYVDGRIQTRRWEDKDGLERQTTEIVAQRVQFLGAGGTKMTPDAEVADIPEQLDETVELPF